MSQSMFVYSGISGGGAQPKLQLHADTICEPQERNEVLYQWKEDEHLLARNEFIIGNLYNVFQTEKSMEMLVKTIANYILEGIYFTADLCSS